MSTSGKERREAFRIDNPIAIDYKILTEAQFKRGVRQVRAGGFPPGGISATLFGMENDVQEKLAHVRLRSREAADAMQMINDKLNALINLMPLLQATNEQILEQPLRDGNLSATGIAFANEERLEENSPLYLRLLLAPNYCYIECYARVVRSFAAEKPKPEYPWTVAVNFVAISKTQRELLIRHTMHRETEFLRARRMQA